MSSSSLLFLMGTLSEYVCFGLALYALCALVTVLWVRRHDGFVLDSSFAEVWRAYGCLILLISLQTVQLIWDCFYARHALHQITRTALPVLYLLVGNSAMRSVHHDIHQTSSPLEQTIAPKAEAKSA